MPRSLLYTPETKDEAVIGTDQFSSSNAEEKKVGEKLLQGRVIMMAGIILELLT